MFRLTAFLLLAKKCLHQDISAKAQPMSLAPSHPRQLVLSTSLKGMQGICGTKKKIKARGHKPVL